MPVPLRLVALVLAVGLGTLAAWPGRARESTSGKTHSEATGQRSDATEPLSADAAPSDSSARSIELAPTLGSRSVQILESALPPDVLGGAEEADVTVLRIRARSSAGAVVSAGRVHVLYADDPFPESALAPRTIERALGGEFASVGEFAGETVIELPAWAFEAIVTVSSPREPPAQARCARLRDVDGRWMAQGRVERVVDIVLAAASTAPAIHGSIRVDGRAEVPPDLLVRALPDESGGHAPPGGRTSYLATIDGFAAAYRIDAPDVAWAGVWATSSITAPVWVPLRASASGELRADLELVRGRTLELHVFDAATGLPAAGLCLQSELLVATGGRGTVREYRADARPQRCDANGRLEISGLPSSGYVSVRHAWSRAEPDPRVVFELALEPGLPAHLERHIDVDLARSAQFTAWGHSADACTPAAEPVLVRARDAARTLHTAAALPDGTWACALPAASSAQLWLDQGGTRVSEFEEVRGERGSRVGPLTFQLRPMRTCEVRWSNAEGRGERLKVRSLGADGVPSELVREWTLDAPAGERTIAIPDVNAIEVELVTEARDRVVRRFAASELEPFLELDLCADRARPLRWISGEFALEREARLFLCAVDGERALLAEVALTSDGSSAPVPLPAGRYFHRLDGTPAHVFACGVVEQPVVLADAWTVGWAGRWTACTAIGAPADTWIEFARCGGRDVTERVPAPLRRFPRPPLGVVTSELADAFLVPAGCDSSP